MHRYRPMCLDGKEHYKANFIDNHRMKYENKPVNSVLVICLGHS